MPAVDKSVRLLRVASRRFDLFWIVLVTVALLASLWCDSFPLRPSGPPLWKSCILVKNSVEKSAKLCQSSYCVTSWQKLLIYSPTNSVNKNKNHSPQGRCIDAASDASPLLIYRKILKIRPGAYIFERPFLGAGLTFGACYLQREICVSKSIWLALYLEGNLPFLLCLLCIWGQFPSTSPRGGLYLEGLFNGGFLRYEFGGLIFGGAYFRNFMVYTPLVWWSPIREIVIMIS